MSDSAVPETWADARKLILGNAPWILLLVAVERAIEGHFTQAVVSLVLCFIALGIAIHWKAFEGLGTREGRRRLAFIFIIVGAAILMVGIYLLARAPIVGAQQIGGGAAGVAGIPATDKAATPALQVTPTSRPKPVITELLAESGALLDIVQKTLIPLEHEWRVALGGQYPERLCLGLSPRVLLDQISGFVERLRAADKDILQVLEQNRIDRKELAPLIGYSDIMDGTQLPGIAAGLANYGNEIKKLGENPTCEEVVKSEISRKYYDMTNVLNSFYHWVSQSQAPLSNFRDALRNEARNTP